MQRSRVEAVLLTVPAVAVWFAQPDVLAARMAFAASATTSVLLYVVNRRLAGEQSRREATARQTTSVLARTAAVGLLAAAAIWWSADRIVGSYGSGLRIACVAVLVTVCLLAFGAPIDRALRSTIGRLRRPLMVDDATGDRAGERPPPAAERRPASPGPSPTFPASSSRR